MWEEVICGMGGCGCCDVQCVVRSVWFSSVEMCGFVVWRYVVRGV